MPKIINEDKLKDVDKSIVGIVDYVMNKFNVNAVITSGGRSYAHQVEMYKEKFGNNWEKHIPKHSAHVFQKGEKAHAIDWFVQNMFITKLHAELLNISTKFKITGLGIDIFKGYIHMDNKKRGLGYVKLWAYDSNGAIIYLN